MDAGKYSAVSISKRLSKSYPDGIGFMQLIDKGPAQGVGDGDTRPGLHQRSGLDQDGTRIEEIAKDRVQENGIKGAVVVGEVQKVSLPGTDHGGIAQHCSLGICCSCSIARVC